MKNSKLPEYYALKSIEQNTLKTVNVGDTASLTKTITEKDIDALLFISGDNNPLHTDEGFAQRTMFKGRIVHGIIAAALVSSALTRLFGPGNVWLSQNITFKTPIRLNDTLTAQLRITEINKSRVCTIETKCLNQKNEIVLDGTATSRIFHIKGLKER